MAKSTKPIERTFRASFTVFNRLRSVITVNTMPIKIQGLINMAVLANLEQRILQEWYLNHMGDPDYMDAPTDPANPLDDFQLVVTGMVVLECDEEGNMADWIKR